MDLMQNKDVLVSIGLPTYKCESRIRGVLDALLGQDYRNIEIIISDDASPDQGYKIIEEYATKDNRIRIYNQKKNIGYLRNFELVLKEARGEYFFWAADDDMWEPNFVSVLKDILDKNLDYALAMPSMKQVFADGQVYKNVFFEGWKDLTKLNHLQVFQMAVKKNPPIEFLYYGLWRMDALKKMMFNEYFDGFPNTIAHDKTLMYEASLSYRFYTIPDVLWYKTVHREVFFERYSTDSKKMFLDKKGYFKFVWGAIKRLTLSPNIPFSQKILLPYCFTLLIWYEKKNLLKELFPKLFWSLYKIFGKNKV